MVHFAGHTACGTMNLSIPASPPENGILEVKDGVRALVGSGLRQDETASVTLHADPGIVGSLTGAVQATAEGAPAAIDYYSQVVTEEYVIGYLTASVMSEGVACNVYRSFEMLYAG